MKALNELIEIFSDVDHSLLIKKSLHNKFIRSTLKKRFPKGLKSAAILLPIIDIEGSLEILLTKRSTHLTTHAGEICFPGGGSEKKRYRCFHDSIT